MANGAPATADRDYATIKTTLVPAARPRQSPRIARRCRTRRCRAPAVSRPRTCWPRTALARGVNPANVIVSFHFTTQSTRDTLRALGPDLQPGRTGAGDRGQRGAGHPAQPDQPGAAGLSRNARFGTVTVPYYSYIPTALAPGGISTDSRRVAHAANRRRAAADSPIRRANATSRASTRCRRVTDTGDPAAGHRARRAERRAGKPPRGWPVVIFQHGITRDRSDASRWRRRSPQAGWVIAAVDLPLHGITNDRRARSTRRPNEQTFNLDLVVQHHAAPRARTASSTPPARTSSTCRYPLASRDNLRQGAVNLLALLRALPTLDLDGNPATVDIDADAHRVRRPCRWAASSASAFSAVDSVCRRRRCAAHDGAARCRAAASPSCCAIRRRSARASTPACRHRASSPGTSLYAQFFRDAQTIVDAGDPLQLRRPTARAAAYLLPQMVGGAESAPAALPDQVIPNSRDARLITAIHGAGGDLPARRARPRDARLGLRELHRGRPRLAALAGGQRGRDRRNADRDGRPSRVHRQPDRSGRRNVRPLQRDQRRP